MGLLSAEHHLGESYALPEEEEDPGCLESLGELFNHLLILQKLSTLLSPKKICPKNSMIRFANFELITVCEIGLEKTSYQHNISDSFPVGAAGLEPALPAL